MSLEKQIEVDQIEVTQNGSVQVRTATKTIENDTVISSLFHRHVVAPGDDYSAEDASVQAVCAATHTAGVVAAYAAEQAKIAPALPKA
jgi:phytoene dehydrogenase-like protein